MRMWSCILGSCCEWCMPQGANEIRCSSAFASNCSPLPTKVQLQLSWQPELLILIMLSANSARCQKLEILQVGPDLDQNNTAF